jgi:ABC-type transporter Mla subunit MlaD
MGRPSKLTDAQWQAIGKRLLDGGSARALGREFGVAESAIRKRFGAHNQKIKDVANQLVAAETAFKSLPISAQISARTLADRLKAISENLADAAHYGAMTAHRLSGIAHAQVEKVDDADPMKSIEALAGVATLTKMANASSEIGLNLLRANKEAADEANKGKHLVSAGLTHFYGESDGETDA